MNRSAKVVAFCVSLIQAACGPKTLTCSELSCKANAHCMEEQGQDARCVCNEGMLADVGPKDGCRPNLCYQRNDEFVVLPSMNQARGFTCGHYHAQTGRVLVFGGSVTKIDQADSAEAYDLTTGEWELLNAPPQPTSAMGCGAMGNQFVLAGGIEDPSTRNNFIGRTDVLLYNFVADIWVEGPPMNSPRAWAGGATVEHEGVIQFCMFGGRGNYDEGELYQNTVECYNGSSWSTTAELPQRVYGSAVVSARVGTSSSLYSIGGGIWEHNQDPQDYNKIVRYHPETMVAAAVAELDSPAGGLIGASSATGKAWLLIDSQLWMVNTRSGNFGLARFAFVPVQPTDAPANTYTRFSYPAMVVLPEGVLLAGGGGQNNKTTTVQLYCPPS